jgi:hypothetical protein
MGPPGVVEIEVPSEASLGAVNRVVGAKIDFFVLDRAPDPLDEYVVQSRHFTVHADRYATGLQGARAVVTHQLVPLVDVEDLRLAVLAEGLPQYLHAERRAHADRYPVRQHAAVRPVDDGAQITPAAGHQDVRVVGRPDLLA